MSTYRIFLTGTVSAGVDVEADSLEEAFENALDNAPQTDFAFAKFEGVDDWNISDEYYVDDEYVSGK